MNWLVVWYCGSPLDKRFETCSVVTINNCTTQLEIHTAIYKALRKLASKRGIAEDVLLIIDDRILISSTGPTVKASLSL